MVIEDKFWAWVEKRYVDWNIIEFVVVQKWLCGWMIELQCGYVVLMEEGAVREKNGKNVSKLIRITMWWMEELSWYRRLVKILLG